jgi:hypothetical protein
LVVCLLRAGDKKIGSKDLCDDIRTLRDGDSPMHLEGEEPLRNLLRP